MAFEQDIEFFQGNDITFMLSLFEEDGVTPLSLLGAVNLEWALAKRATSAANLVHKTLADGVVVLDSDGGEDSAEVTLDSEDTEAIKAGEYYHECYIVDLEGNKSTLVFGICTIKAALLT